MLFDFRVAARTLSKSPGFSFTAMAALALGIGANAAIFSLVNQVLLHPAGVAHPESVVAVRARYTKLNLPNITISATDFKDVHDSRNIFQHAAMFEPGDFNYSGGTAPERLQGAMVTTEWFDVFGARPIAGRIFRAEEDQPAANGEVILAYRTWQRLFGGEPSAIGRTMMLNERIYRVIGVMGPEFAWPREAELWTPLGLAPEGYGEQSRFNESYLAYARLQPGISFERANAYIDVLAQHLRQSNGQLAEYARDAGWGMFAMPLTQFVAGDTRKPLLILLGAVGLVLLIACSNIAGLMLARTSGRAREIAVRVALGAGRWQVLRQTLAESVLLACGGALAGLALGYAGIRALLALAPEGAAAGLAPRLDVYVLAFAGAATVISALLFGFAPSWQIGRMQPNEILKGAGRSGMAGRGRQRLRAGLVICETALALMLLVGAGLFLRSLQRVEDISPGFDPRGVLTAQLTLQPQRYPNATKRLVFFRALEERLAAIPGVVSATIAESMPFTGVGGSASFAIQEKPVGPGDPGPHGDIASVSPAYFRTLRIPLKAGRFFDDADRAGAPWVALVDENLARQYWPNQNPIGQHIRGGNENQWATIVGIVGHVHRSDLASDSGKGMYYFCFWQYPKPFAPLAIRTAADPAHFAPALREAVASIDPTQPVHDVKTMQDLVETSLGPRRFIVRLLGFFALAALFLAALGLYGVIGYSVSQRTQEIGIRVALGASRGAVLRMVVGQGLRLAAAGAAIGLAVSVALGSWLKTLLTGASSADPVTMAITAAVLLAAAALASYLPARRAMRVNATEALRWE